MRNMRGFFVAVVACGLALAGGMIAGCGRSDLSQRTADAANLQKIFLGLQVYMVESGNVFPPSLAAVTTVNNPDPKVFVSAASSTPSPVYARPVKDWHPLIAEVDGHTDYVFPWAGVNTGGGNWLEAHDVIWVYSKNVYGGQGRNILFADGHVAFVPTANLAATFAASNEGAKGFAPLLLDGPPDATWRGYRQDVVNEARRAAAVAAAAPAARAPAAAAPVPPPPRQIPLAGRAVYYPPEQAIKDLQGSDLQRRREVLDYVRTMHSAGYDAQAAEKIRPVLEGQLKNPADQSVTMQALSAYATPASIDPLLAYLKENSGATQDEQDARAMAVEWVLPKFHDPRVRAYLVGCLGDDQVGKAAARGLSTVGEDAERDVLSSLKQATATGQVNGCNALAKIGTAASLADLQELTRGTNASVRTAAQAAMDAIKSRGR